MTQTQNKVPSKSFSRELVLKILSESGVHDADTYLTDEMVHEFGFGGSVNLEALMLSLENARDLRRVRRLTCDVDFAAANRFPVPTLFGKLPVGSFKAMDWNLCAWEVKDSRLKPPNCRKFSRKNRPMEFVPVKQKVVGRGFSIRSGLGDLETCGVRPVLAQEFACYCMSLGGVAQGIELVGLGSVLVRSQGDSVYCFHYLAFDHEGFRVTVEREKNNNSTDRFFIGVSQD